MTTVIARTAARFVVPIILVTSVALLLQGHNLPGGGFIAGVLTATGIVLLYVVFGLDGLRFVLDTETGTGEFDGPVAWYRAILAVGLALAIGSGLVPILFDFPFLTQSYWILHLPLYGEFEVASAFAFDLGVYLTVVGALLTIIGIVGTE